MTLTSFTRTLLTAALVFSLSGCSALDSINSTMATTNKNDARGQQDIRTMNHPQPVTEMSGQWINPTPIGQMTRKEQLPPCSVTLTRPGTVSLNDVLAFVSKSCHIPATVTADAQSAVAGATGGTTQKVSGRLPLPESGSGMPALASMGGAGASVAAPVTGTTLKGVFWQGSASGLLDNITTRLGLSWRYRNGHVEVYYLDTRNFPILFMDNVTQFSSKVVSGTTTSDGSSGGDSGSSSGGLSGNNNTQQTTNSGLSTNIYKDIEKAVQSMLTPGVGREYLSAGMLTVTDTPQTLDAIKAYIDGRNKELNRQVVLNVEVLSITKHNEDQLGIDWSLIFNSGDIAGSVANAFTGTASDALGGSATILNGRFAGSSAFIHALSEQANVSILTQEASTTTNMSAVPVQVGTQQDYVGDITTTNTADVGTETSITKSTVTTGFNMTVLPYLLPASDQMQLLASVSMSDDPTFTTATSGDASTQLMKTHLKTFIQRTMLKNGQTLVLSGYQQMNDNATKQGVGSSSFWGLGGGGDAQNDKTMIVILITPTILG